MKLHHVLGRYPHGPAVQVVDAPPWLDELGYQTRWLALAL
jgi:hypothetical protein